VRRIGLILGTIVLLAVVAAGPAAAQTSPSGERFIDRTLTIRTMPAVEGLRFRFQGETYRTNARGLVELPHAAVIAPNPPRALDGRLSSDVRVRFARYFGDQHSGEIKATYDVDYRVTFDFTDLVGHEIPPSAIEEMTYKSSIGFRDTVESTGAQWLQGARVVPESSTALAMKTILYRLERVVVHGTNVVNRAEQSFEPRFKRHVSVQLLYYTASFSARDAFFGFKIGSKVKITYPDGTVETYPLGSDGRVTVPSLPRGEYDVTVEGGGIPISRPLSLSTNSNLQIEVLSYLDIGVVLGVLLLFVVGLPLIRRPYLVTGPIRWLTRRGGREPSRAREASADLADASTNGASGNGSVDPAWPPSEREPSEPEPAEPTWSDRPR
jgi:hypothetical protein